MKIKTPLQRANIKTHFTYYFWAYLLVIAGAIFGWNLLYTVTAYRSPENKRVDLYIQSSTVSDQTAKEFIQPIWDQYVPDMEVVDAVLLQSKSDDYYSAMQLTVYIMSQEGDIYILSSSDFKNYAAQGAFLDLKPFVNDGQLHIDGIDVSAGYVAMVDENGLPVAQRQMFGVPLYSLYGYMDGLYMDNRDMVLAVTAYNNNTDNVIKFVDGFLEAGRGDPPEWLNNPQ